MDSRSVIHSRQVADRMPRIVGAPDDPAAVLARKHVAVTGLGSIGQVAAEHLARAGIGALTLVDRGRFKPASLATHPIAPAAVGRPKAEYAAERVRAIRPDIGLAVHHAAFQHLPIDALDCDALLLAVDNLGTECDVMQWSLRRGVPLIQSSVHGGTMVATVRTFPAGDGSERPCLACGYSAAEWRQVADEPRYSCDGSGDGTGEADAGTRGPQALQPTRSLSSLCALAAELGVHRLLRHFLGFGLPLEAATLEYRGHTDELVTTRLRRNPACRLDHERWTAIDRADAATLAAIPAVASAGEDACLSVDRSVWVDSMPCICGATTQVYRFVAAGASPGPCIRCGRELLHSPFHARRRVRATALAARLHRPLVEVGIRPGSAIVVRDERADRTTLVLDRGANRGANRTGGTQ